LVAGDAAGAITPFNGEGIAYAYEPGRMAADVLHEALVTGDGLALADYDRRLQDTYGLYYKVARAFVKIIGRPELMRALVGTGMRSRTLMDWVLRIMANLLRPDEIGPADAAYDADDGRRPALELHRRVPDVETLTQGLATADGGEDRRDHLVRRSVAHAGQQEDHHVGAEEDGEAAVLHTFDGDGGGDRH